jgi:hypothetical protein
MKRSILYIAVIMFFLAVVEAPVRGGVMKERLPIGVFGQSVFTPVGSSIFPGMATSNVGLFAPLSASTPFPQFSAESSPSTASLAGDGFFSRRLLFDAPPSGPGGDPNEDGSLPTGGYLPVENLPWIAMLLIAGTFAMGIRWRRRR